MSVAFHVQVPPSPQNILHVIRLKTPLISKYLSITFQLNEQSPKYSIILHEKQHSYESMGLF
jgi:hypothetical protein